MCHSFSSCPLIYHLLFSLGLQCIVLFFALSFDVPFLFPPILHCIISFFLPVLHCVLPFSLCFSKVNISFPPVDAAFNFPSCHPVSHSISPGSSTYHSLFLLSFSIIRFTYLPSMHHVVAEWLRAWDTLTMFEATVCGRSWVQSPTGTI